MREVDVAIVGAGLAGTTLTWQFLNAGLDVVLIDKGKPSTCSRIAAGLMTPITGKRFAISWEWDSFWPEANAFYRDVENRTTSSFFSQIQMLRLFQSDAEREFFENRQEQFGDLLISTSPEIDSTLFVNNFGGFEMLGGKLDVPGYLDASKRYFKNEGRFLVAEINPATSISVEGDHVLLRDADVFAKHLVFCLGYSKLNSEFFPAVRFNPAKGEILTVSMEQNFSRIVHSGIWIAPASKETFQVGATYDWEDLSRETTLAARDFLTMKLDEIFKGNYEVIRQDAAIRPAMHDFRPVVGFHSENPRIGILNGLGSKGSLMVPRLARMLTSHLADGSPIPCEVSIQRWFD